MVIAMDLLGSLETPFVRERERSLVYHRVTIASEEADQRRLSIGGAKQRWTPAALQSLSGPRQRERVPCGLRRASQSLSDASASSIASPAAAGAEQGDAKAE